ncbi:hypothetical protein LCGC14_1821780, partial [marine sediment metagenome]
QFYGKEPEDDKPVVAKKKSKRTTKRRSPSANKKHKGESKDSEESVQAGEE